MRLNIRKYKHYKNMLEMQRYQEALNELEKNYMEFITAVLMKRPGWSEAGLRIPRILWDDLEAHLKDYK